MIAAALFLPFIALHRIDGHTVMLNPREISSMMSPQTNRERIIHHNAQCVVFMTDGRYYAVMETCEQIQKSLNDRLVD